MQAKYLNYATIITIPSPPDEADDGDTQFVEQPDGQRHDKKRKQIGGGGDDGGDDEDEPPPNFSAEKMFVTYLLSRGHEA